MQTTGRVMYSNSVAVDVLEYEHDPSSDLYRRVLEQSCILVFSGEAEHARIADATSLPCVVATTVAAMRAALPRALVMFADLDLVDQLDASSLGIPVVAIVDGDNVLDRIVDTLGALPWLMSFVAASLLGTPAAREQVGALIEHVQCASKQVLLGEAAVGRMALLTESNRRESRFERIRSYFSKHGVADRALRTIEDVYEELVTNALYDAPYEARYFDAPVPRTEDVELPRARACEISYGLDGDTAFLRVRDTFGALRRERLVQVLQRCRTEGTLDESRGGAGLGLWRVFCAASTIAITVIPGELTDIIVGVPIKKRGPKELVTASLTFETSSAAGDAFVPGGDHETVDNSVTLVFVA